MSGIPADLLLRELLCEDAPNPENPQTLPIALKSRGGGHLTRPAQSSEGGNAAQERRQTDSGRR